ncbi:hypothetical protein DVR12_19460 [Chitinophaga silvatica]|uniref:Peptidase S9 prolyl oligopeptidase catalytic domain-containing protein n=1 Tax=Chitinophaga silvatica TaxID=2282649 RepID=A0A3E1Y703_9BACT|nr:prolyl oligopeptidase family serine peptidase [Chitinophaga silvatica]RFS20736.1 hypothetical protein DVR12_19460 [Chitinophaga silvatica]
MTSYLFLSIRTTLIFFLFDYICFCGIAKAQSNNINREDYMLWTALQNPYLTNNGEYLKYEVQKVESKDKIIVVKSINSNWHKEFKNGDVFFLNDDKCLLNVVNDTLNFFWLGTDRNESLIVNSYNIPDVENKNIIMYQLSSNPMDICQLDLEKNINNKIINIGKVLEYYYLPKNMNVIVKVRLDSVEQIVSVKYIERGKVNAKELIRSKDISPLVFDIREYNVACILKDSEEVNNICVIPLRTLMPRVIKSSTFNLHDSSVTDIFQFTLNSDSLLVNIKPLKIEPKKKDLDMFKLTIWSYKDGILPIKSKEVEKSRFYYYSIKENNFSPYHEESLVTPNKYLDSLFRVSYPSPDKEFFIYNDNGNFFSYEVATGISRNITATANNNWGRAENNDYDVFGLYPRVVGWADDKRSAFIQDEFDLWKVSVLNEYLPLNITNGIGRKNKIKFTPIFFNQTFIPEKTILKANQPILFSAFNCISKENGFYYKRNYNSKDEPVLLTMDKAMYYIPFTPAGYGSVVSSSWILPTKAKKADIYLVGKSTSQSSLNFYVTKDFKSFTQVTENYPERKFNWPTNELINWTTKEGNKLQGILYKPGNFDSTRKYPVIFYYYRKSSDNLNSFIIPKECPGCTIDIPGYASSGYLVFTPDIYFSKGETGKNAMDAVTSAAEFLSKKEYVDKNRMGVQGCSFSGFTTNYIVTHTNIFAAACSASGLSDMVSGYNSINDGDIKQPQFEGGAYQIGSTLWENPNLYIENSAVFSANKLTTPLLLMHTTQDPTVPFNNAVELFLAGKRLNKRIWMLEYANQYHTLSGSANHDFAIRMKQFFDYYLKGALPPEWMTVPDLLGSDKIGNGYGLDSFNRIP